MRCPACKTGELEGEPPSVQCPACGVELEVTGTLFASDGRASYSIDVGGDPDLARMAHMNSSLDNSVDVLQADVAGMVAPIVGKDPDDADVAECTREAAAHVFNSSVYNKMIGRIMRVTDLVLDTFRWLGVDEVGSQKLAERVTDALFGLTRELVVIRDRGGAQAVRDEVNRIRGRDRARKRGQDQGRGGV